MAVTAPNGFGYQYVPHSSTAVQLGAVGAPGNYLHRLILLIDAPGNAGVTLLDGAIVIPVVTAAAQLARGPVSIEMNIVSRFGPFRLTTGSGVAVIVAGATSV